jgi:hydroxyethylthiazole kinase
MRDAYSILERVRERRPLVHHITNWVTIYDCANMSRAFGALPVMAHAREEAAEMAGQADALVLNIGTLTPELVDTMVLAAQAANDKGIPVVLDAVGAGATRLRTDCCTMILKDAKVDILKGNYGEMGTLAGAQAKVRGVENAGLEGDPSDTATRLALMHSNTVAMTGKRDIVSDGSRRYRIDNGTPLMGSIVGTGCMAASVIGAFAAVERDRALAASSALACFGIAGQLAAKGAKGPGSFKSALYDEASSLTQEEVEALLAVDCR